MTQIDTSIANAPSDELIAEPETGYRWKHLITAALLFAGGCWFAYDGWVKWPAENARIVKIQADKTAAQATNRAPDVEALAAELSKLSHHTDADLLIQKLLAVVLPLFGLFWGIWTLKDTRGVYRLIGDTLEVPWHPPISIGTIRRIDKRKWDRKGIAYIHYELGQPPVAGICKLDDFAYDRTATDEILERIEKSVLGGPVVTTTPNQ
jgi:hypothetical protein